MPTVLDVWVIAQEWYTLQRHSLPSYGLLTFAALFVLMMLEKQASGLARPIIAAAQIVLGLFALALGCAPFVIGPAVQATAAG